MQVVGGRGSVNLSQLGPDVIHLIRAAASFDLTRLSDETLHQIISTQAKDYWKRDHQYPYIGDEASQLRLFLQYAFQAILQVDGFTLEQTIAAKKLSAGLREGIRKMQFGESKGALENVDDQRVHPARTGKNDANAATSKLSSIAAKTFAEDGVSLADAPKVDGRGTSAMKSAATNRTPSIENIISNTFQEQSSVGVLTPDTMPDCQRGQKDQEVEESLPYWNLYAGKMEGSANKHSEPTKRPPAFSPVKVSASAEAKIRSSRNNDEGLSAPMPSTSRPFGTRIDQASAWGTNPRYGSGCYVENNGWGGPNHYDFGDNFENPNDWGTLSDTEWNPKAASSLW